MHIIAIKKNQTYLNSVFYFDYSNFKIFYILTKSKKYLKELILPTNTNLIPTYPKKG